MRQKTRKIPKPFPAGLLPALLISNAALAEPPKKVELERYKPGQVLMIGDEASTNETNNGFYIHQLNPRATTVFDFGVRSDFRLQENNEIFMEYTERRKGVFDPVFLGGGLSIDYKYFKHTNVISPSADPSLMQIVGVGAGNAIVASPSLVFAGALGTTPLELETYLSLGYMAYHLNINLESSGTTNSVGAKGLYSDFWGLELRAPTNFSANIPPLRFERLGAGIASTQRNQFFYASYSTNFSSSKKHLVRNVFTPTYYSLADETSFGAELLFLQSQYRAKHATIITTPGAAIEYNLTSNYIRGNAFVGIDLCFSEAYQLTTRFGWDGAVTGQQPSDPPQTAYASINLTVHTQK